MKRLSFIVLAVFCVAAALPALGADAVPTEMDPVKAARAVKLAEKLRCLVCQNQTIADSNAELANDLRGQIREQIAAGRSDEQILEYMTNRYGDFVLYQPPFKATTVLLWLGPAVLLLGGIAVLLRNLARRRAGEVALNDEVALTAEEKSRAEQLLAGENGKKKT
jgi:cytochrome c-type biogenesis protein CcmH